MDIVVNNSVFESKAELSDMALNILEKRYLAKGEKTWDDIVDRIIKHVLHSSSKDDKKLTREMILNRYFIPNSPCIVNSGKKSGGLLACFVVDLQDSIRDIYQTKLDFALIAKKGGGAGTSLSFLRPEGSMVSGSVHGHAGGPVKFFDTICYDMTAMTQAGFREMAMMGTMSVYHPDIIKFIKAKSEEGRMHTTNISVVVDDAFMKCVQEDKEFTTSFEGKEYDTYKARDIFNLVVESAWKNGEPGLLFMDSMNDSPYKYADITIHATNPCGEQPLPFNGSCNLGSIDISKFLDDDNTINVELLELATRLSIRFLDSVLDVNEFPTDAIKEMSVKCRQVGLGIMGLADYYLARGVSYGSDEALEELSFILGFIKSISEDESITLGEEKGVPEYCSYLPNPRRNITLLSIAPTGTISLLAGCNSGIEPFFSEVTNRSDRTGNYTITGGDIENLPAHFSCAVSANGGREVTWQEHVATQSTTQRFVDSGVSKTINFPNYTHKETIGKAFMRAWESGCKGITVYRNGSRSVEVLSPKNLDKESCPLCESAMIYESGCSKCSNLMCGFSVCSVG